jgi:hypothetical protein
MFAYDPDQTPDPVAWLAAPETERIAAARSWHAKAKVKLPNPKAHAALHAIVENQIAVNMESVQRAVTRLQSEGLDRHEAIHAIAWVLSTHLFDLMSASEPDNEEVANARYSASVERLTAKAWRQQESV